MSRTPSNAVVRGCLDAARQIPGSTVVPTVAAGVSPGASAARRAVSKLAGGVSHRNRPLRGIALEGRGNSDHRWVLARIADRPGFASKTALALKGLLLLLLLVTTVRADDFATGNELFDQGKFTESKQHYEKLVEEGQGSANVYYNLANADFRLGSPGRAMLNYERTLALDPRHPEALANLKLLREQSGSKLPPATRITNFFSSQPLNTWTLAATIAGWLTIFCVAGLATSRRADKGALWFLTALAAAGLAISGLGVWFGMKDQSLGIITAKQAESRLAPAEGAGMVEILPAGSRVRVLSERGAWTYCELPGAGRGWIPQGMLERVRPTPAS